MHNLTVPVMPVNNLWSIWNNTILYTCFNDFIYIKNLYTKHKKVFYLYDLNWHEKSLNYEFTLDAIRSADVLICRSSYHADKIEEYSGRRPLIISEINIEEIVR